MTTNKVRVPEPGEILGQNYLLEKELGRGGFGVVFRARHIDIDREVAIKVLLATYALKDPRAKDRFKREATIAASLDYPNSLRIFDYGETDEGVFYIVMEYVRGSDLGKVLQREGVLPIPRAIHIARQILHALMEAHARGIVHRDIKPDNVMLVELAYDRDHVKVMDFGIAKMVDGGEEITQHGITLGTPRYMPIEQLKGEHLGPATDLYATGLVLYEMLVGRPAFTGETAVDTAVAVMDGGSVQVPADAGVPEALAAIIAKASARHAEDRYPSARAFLEALNALDPALLDVDEADRERFPLRSPAADEADRPIDRRATTEQLRVEGRHPKPAEDFEDLISTQAISTEAVLAAEPPARALQPTPSREQAAGRVEPSKLVGPADATSAMPTGLPSPRAVLVEATSGMPVAETSAFPAAATTPVRTRAARAPGLFDAGHTVLFAIAAATLVLQVIILLRML